MNNNTLLTLLGDRDITGVGSTSLEFAGLFANVFTIAVVVGGLFVFYHLMLGALDWINSAGDKEKLEKARKRMTSALIGLVILVAVWILYFTITADILGIFERDGEEIKIKLPSLFN